MLFIGKIKCVLLHFKSIKLTQIFFCHQAKALYQKLANHAQSLKGLWVAKLNLKGRFALATEEDIAKYERTKEQLELELARRKELGLRFEAVLQRQLGIMEEDEKYREEHHVAFMSALRESIRLLNDYAQSLSMGQRSLEDEFDDSMHQQ